jgi:hypothetical protein
VDDTVVYKYDIAKNDFIELFKWSDDSNKYLSPIIISPQEQRLAFELHGCTECGGRDLNTTSILIFNPSAEAAGTDKFKVITDTLNFRFEGPTKYKYEEALIDNNTDRECHGACYKIGNTVSGEF